MQLFFDKLFGKDWSECCKQHDEDYESFKKGGKMIKLSNDFNMPLDYKSNGCGAEKARFDFVPDTIYGVDIKPACRLHDYAYKVGKTIEDKQHADREFLNNMLRLIEANKNWYYPTMLARRRALKYYEAVVAFGGVAFWEGKNTNEIFK